MADEVTAERFRTTARKRTWCDWCGKPIAKGEEYVITETASSAASSFMHGCYRCNKYVKEMYAIHPQVEVRPLDSFDFDEFMTDFHPSVLDEWR